MNKLVVTLLLLLVWGSRFSIAQLDSHSNAATAQRRYSLPTLTKYCDGVERFSNTQEPRIFVRLAELGQSAEWTEFFSLEDWRHFGKPEPIALVWYKEDKLVRVTITSPDGMENGNSYADYCYRPDGSLARLRLAPKNQTVCDQSSFRCSYTFRLDRLYAPGFGDQRSSLAETDEYFDLRPLKSEKMSFRFASMEWPEYLNVSDLPFNRLLYASSQ